MINDPATPNYHLENLGTLSDHLQQLNSVLSSNNYPNINQEIYNNLYKTLSNPNNKDVSKENIIFVKDSVTTAINNLTEIKNTLSKEYNVRLWESNKNSPEYQDTFNADTSVKNYKSVVNALGELETFTEAMTYLNL